MIDELEQLSDDQLIDLLQMVLGELAARSYMVRKYTQDLIGRESKKFTQWCDQIEADTAAQLSDLRNKLRKAAFEMAKQMVEQQAASLVPLSEIENIRKSAEEEAKVLREIVLENMARKEGFDTLFTDFSIPLEWRVSAMFKPKGKEIWSLTYDRDITRKNARRAKLATNGITFYKTEGFPGFIHGGTMPRGDDGDPYPLKLVEDLLTEVVTKLDKYLSPFASTSSWPKFIVPAWNDAKNDLKDRIRWEGTPQRYKEMLEMLFRRVQMIRVDHNPLLGKQIRFDDIVLDEKDTTLYPEFLEMLQSIRTI